MQEISEGTKDGVGWNEALGEHATNPATPRATGETITVYKSCEVCGSKGRGEDKEPCDVCSGTGKSSEVEKVWTVSSCENRIKAQFETWVRKNAKEAVAEAERMGDEQEADALRSVYSSDLGAGHYRWDGKHVRKARRDVPGIVHFLYLLLKRCHPTVTEEDAFFLFTHYGRQVGMALSWATEGNF